MINIKFPETKVSYYPIKGGLDLVTPAIGVNPGTCFDSQNYEPSPVGGYRRINGFERYDGHTTPTSANYWIITATVTGTVAVGNTLTGLTSAATGKVLAISGSTIVLGRVSGTFQNGEALQVGGVTQATATSTANILGAADPSDHADDKLLSANDRRTDILVVPGSGRIRGVWVYNDTVYAFRNNAGGTAGDMYKATASGWSQIIFGSEISFAQLATSSTVTITIASPGVVSYASHPFINGQPVKLTTTGALPTGLVAGDTYYVVNSAAGTFQLAATAGGTAINTSGTQSGTHTCTAVGGQISAGSTITGVTSGATATVKAALLRTGTWTVSPIGTLVIDTITGTFQSGEALKVSNILLVTTSSTAATITRAVGGSMEFVNANFTGSTATEKMYGCDGANTAFEFDGTNYVPIHTGMTTDTPSHIAFHRNYLFLSFLGSLQYSGLGSPYSWTVLTGAGEIGMGETITGMLSQAGSASGASLAAFTRGQTSILYGSSNLNFTLIPSVYSIGYSAFTLQPVGNDTYGLTSTGIQALTTTQNFGNFNYAAISFLVQPFIDARLGIETASTALKAKNQYRVFFSDGYGLVVSLTGSKIAGIMPLNYGKVVRCMCTAKLSTGEEVTYFGSDDGYVYRDNVGTSFDGEVIESWLRPAVNNLQSPRVRKQFRKAIFEVKNDGYSSVNITYDIGYGSSDAAPAATQADTELIGAGGYWDCERILQDYWAC